MKKYGKMSKIVIFWQNVKMVLFDVFEEFVYGINVENVIFCRIYIVKMWISWSWRIKRIIFTNNMIEVRSIMTVNLLISDKSSVSKLCGYRFHSVSPSLDQLNDESATNQIGRSWFWELCLVFQALPSLYGWRYMCLHAGGTCTCRDRGGCCVPWSRTNGDSTWWDGMSSPENPRRHNHDLSYYFDHTESDLVSINPIGEIKFSIGDGDEVRHNKISIIKLMRW